MRSNNKAPVAGAALLLLASCGGTEAGPPPAPGSRPAAAFPVPMVEDGPVTVGAPYQVGGITYTPEDALSYDEVGYAGWYGEELGGGNTASGEAFLASGVSAAHRTLPLPSYVEVTALDSGRTILVRINDRGPFAHDRIIDLSRGAAEQLGIIGDGAAAVRVRRVNPPEQEKAVLRAHGRAAERLETPEPLLAVLRQKLGQRPAAPQVRAQAAKPAPGASYDPAPAPPMPARSRDGFIVERPGGGAPTPPVPKAEPVPLPPAAARTSGGGYVVQVAAFSSRSRAEALARRIGAGAVEGSGIWRVRYGPYATQAAAQAGVRQAASKGFAQARIMANEAP